MADLTWMRTAKQYIGVKEFDGPKHNPHIVRWWKLNQLKYRTDETAWCANFVGGVLEESGLRSTRSLKARSYLNHGKKLSRPAYGCIVVFWREKKEGTLGHVGFVVGKDQKGNLMVLGGNQSDAVNIKPFSKDRILGYRWPTGLYPKKSRYKLPLIKSDGKLSQNEA